MKIKYFLLSFLSIFFFFSCNTVPEIKSFPAENGAIYFIPPTEWNSKSKDIAKLDITYHAGVNTPAVVNITFIGKKTMPRKVTSAVLNGTGVKYPLSNIKAMYADSQKRELRITAEGDRNELLTLLSADPITLAAEIDGELYSYSPHKWFIILKNNFLLTVSIHITE